MKLLLITTALALPLTASAQTIWRCGPDGRSYSQTPCTEGRQLEAQEPRPAADLSAAQARAADERRKAEQMTRERLAQESRQRGNGLAAIAPPQPALKPASAAARPQQAKKRRHPAEADGIWRATAPSTRHTKG